MKQLRVCMKQLSVFCICSWSCEAKCTTRARHVGRASRHTNRHRTRRCVRCP
jgi:hypothetical protein